MYQNTKSFKSLRSSINFFLNCDNYDKTKQKNYNYILTVLRLTCTDQGHAHWTSIIYYFIVNY